MGIPPRTAAGELPQYFQLDPLRYQGLCRDVLQAEAKFRNVEVYGFQGQSQRGVDVIAERTDSPNLVLGQCKRVHPTNFTAGLLKGAVNEFLKYRKYWKSKGADTFILFVSADATDTKVQSERLRQSRRLAKMGIILELWSTAVLSNKLRPHPGIVTTYLTEEWARILCGAAIGGPTVASSHVNNFLVTQLEQVVSQYAETAEREIECFREAWRAGRKDEAAAGIAGYRAHATWQTLANRTKATVLRFAAQLALDDSLLDESRSLAEEAEQLDSGKTIRVRALISRAEGKRDRAIEMLAGSSDPDNVALEAALLMECGRVEEAVLRLDTIPATSDGHRLRALTHLWNGQIPDASKDIDRALMIAPTWTISRYTKAIIDYYAGLSPSTRLKQLPPWPEPQNWGRVKTDDGSRRRFGKAASVFGEMQAQSGLSTEQRRTFETWQLACLCNDPTRREEANALCTDVLSRDPENFGCLVWAVARKLDVNTNPARQKLISKASGETASPDAVITLIICYLEEADFQSASDLVSGAEQVFAARGETRVWRFWRVQVDALIGDSETSVGDLEEDVAGIRRIQLRSMGQRSGDWEPLIAELKIRDGEGDKTATFELCALLANLDRWKDAEPFVERLIEGVETTEAVRLACFILYHAHSLTRCVQVLNERRGLFPNSQLPSALIRMRTAAQRELGEVLSAILSAEDVLGLDPTRPNFLALAELYLEAGDFLSLARLAAKHDRYPDLLADDLLRLAARLAGESRNLAVELWERAQDQGIADDQVVGAIGVGYSLGLDSHMKSLHERLNALPESDSLKRFTLDEVRNLTLSQRSAAEEGYRQYRLGNACIQMANGIFARPLSFWYHRLLQANREHPESCSPLYARSGWRSLGALQLSRDTTRLHADVTALLTAAEIGLLDLIESVFKPIMLPHNSLLALGAMREATTHGQPARKTHLSLVRDALIRGEISVSLPTHQDADRCELGELDTYRCAADKGWLVLDYALHANTPATNASSFEQYADTFRSPHSVLDALLSLGKIPEPKYHFGVEALGIEHYRPAKRDIEEEQFLATNISILEGFARADILNEACSTFKIQILGEAQVDLLNAHLLSFAQSEQDASWLTDLLNRLKNGLDRGTYRLLPIISSDVQVETSSSSRSIELSCLNDLLTYANSPDDVLWIDDRTLNGFVHRDGSKIIDTIDLAHFLTKEQRLSKADLYGFFHRYRASGIRFLALGKEELLYWLNKAASTKGSVAESLELKTIRQQYAKAVADATALRITPTATGLPLEWPFLLDSAAAVLDALSALWYSSKPNPSREEKSLWLLQNLYLPDRGRCHTSIERSAKADLAIEAIGLASLVVRTMTQLEDKHGGRSARRAYLSWLYNRFIGSRFEADPVLAAGSMQSARELLLTAINVNPKTDKRRASVAAALMKTWIDDLPTELRDLLTEDSTFLEGFGITITSVVRIGDRQVNAQTFWAGARELKQSGRPVHVGDVILSIEGKDGNCLMVEDPSVQQTYVLTDVPINLFSRSCTEREAAARVLADQYDLSKIEKEQIVLNMHTERSPDVLMSNFAQLKEQSAPLFYENLRQKISSKELISRADLIPSDMRMFIRYLRLNIEDPESSSAAATMFKGLAFDVTAAEAFERLSGLPRPLPTTFLQRLEGMGTSDRRSLIKCLLRMGSRLPLRDAHLARLLFHFKSDNASYGRLAVRKLRILAREATDNVLPAFLRVLRHIESELWFTRDFGKFGSTQRLLFAWSHAANVMRILVSSRVDLSWVRKNFGKDSSRLPLELLCDDLEYSSDVAHPSRLEIWRLILALLAYASEGGSLLPDDLRASLSQLSVEESEKLISLLSDTSRSPNAMGSFLGEHAGWPDIVMGPAAEFVENTRNPTATAHAAEALLSGSNPIGWIHLQAILRNTSIPQEAEASIRTLLLKTDFVSLLKKEPNIASIAIIFGSHHALRLGEEVLEKVRSEILRFAKEVARDMTFANDDQMESALLSAAFYLYRSGSQNESMYEHVAKMWQELVAMNPRLSESCMRMVDRLIGGLPNKDARHLWKLQISLRATEGS